MIERHRRNLRLLAGYLDTLDPAGFDRAAIHAPAAGVTWLVPGQSWNSYLQYSFGLTPVTTEYLFGDRPDDTPSDAAARCRYVYLNDEQINY